MIVMPYDQRFRDSLRRFRPVGGYRYVGEIKLARLRILNYQRSVQVIQSGELMEISLWDLPGLGAWKVTPPVGSSVRVYVNKRTLRVQWLPYRELRLLLSHVIASVNLGRFRAFAMRWGVVAAGKASVGLPPQVHPGVADR